MDTVAWRVKDHSASLNLLVILVVAAAKIENGPVPPVVEALTLK